MEIAGFLGTVLKAGDQGFDSARQIWNGGSSVGRPLLPAVLARLMFWPLCASLASGSCRSQSEAELMP